MSTDIYISVPAKCKNPDCCNITAKVHNGTRWKKFCSTECQYPNLKDRSIEQAPKCANPVCCQLCYLRSKKNKGWSKYCSPKCQLPNNKIDFDKKFGIIAPKCANPNCINLVKYMSKRNLGWAKYCSHSCQWSDPACMKLKGDTCEIKYGNRNPMKSDIIKNQISNTVEDMWGNRSDEERLLVFKASQRGLSKRKEYVFSSGKKIIVRGFEPKALDELLLVYLESDIVAGNEISISIPYLHNDKKHKYYPDIHIPKDNLIIEVKSKWTYSGKPEWLETNLLKEQATIAAGYNFKFVIY